MTSVTRYSSVPCFHIYVPIKTSFKVANNNISIFQHLHGKKVVHPFHGTLLRIVTDPILVILNFGTGAVKVTPGHDPNDFECGVRNKLPMPELFTDSGEINEVGGPLFQGMKRFDARNAVLEKLKEKGQFSPPFFGPHVTLNILQGCSVV
jgi:valyl-tRNA synthetase